MNRSAETARRRELLRRFIADGLVDMAWRGRAYSVRDAAADGLRELRMTDDGWRWY